MEVHLDSSAQLARRKPRIASVDPISAGARAGLALCPTVRFAGNKQIVGWRLQLQRISGGLGGKHMGAGRCKECLELEGGVQLSLVASADSEPKVSPPPPLLRAPPTTATSNKSNGALFCYFHSLAIY